MEFAVIILLLGRKAGLGQFTDAVVRRPDVQDMIGRAARPSFRIVRGQIMYSLHWRPDVLTLRREKSYRVVAAHLEKSYRVVVVHLLK